MEILDKPNPYKQPFCKGCAWLIPLLVQRPDAIKLSYYFNWLELTRACTTLITPAQDRSPCDKMMSSWQKMIIVHHKHRLRHQSSITTWMFHCCLHVATCSSSHPSIEKSVADNFHLASYFSKIGRRDPDDRGNGIANVQDARSHSYQVFESDNNALPSRIIRVT